MKQPRGASKLARALIAEHDHAIAELLSEALSLSGVATIRAQTADEALSKLEFDSFELLITDIYMPNMKAHELLDRALQVDPDLAVVFLASSLDVPVAVRCLREGAYDYILKPFDLQDVALRSARAVEHRSLRISERERQRELESTIRQQNEQIFTMLQSSLQALAHALEAKDPYTRNHSERVAELSVAIAKEMYPGDQEFHRKVQFAALLHDVGKIGVSESSLSHPGALSDEMYTEIKRHTVIGENILKPIIQDSEILSIVRSHHERFDGGGYPDGLRAGDIPLGARIVAIADAFDAMVSARPYRAARSTEEALSILLQGAGYQWDPNVVEVAIKLLSPIDLAVPA